METQPGNPDAMGVRLPADSHAHSNDPPGMTACSVAAAAWRGGVYLDAQVAPPPPADEPAS
jgi:hypothetical protein